MLRLLTAAGFSLIIAIHSKNRTHCALLNHAPSVQIKLIACSCLVRKIRTLKLPLLIQLVSIAQALEQTLGIILNGKAHCTCVDREAISVVYGAYRRAISFYTDIIHII